MASFTVEVIGIDVARRHLAKMGDTVKALDGMSVLVGTNVQYGRYVEYGTRRMRAQPYLIPAYRDVAEDIPRDVAALFDPPKGASAALDTLLRLGHRIEAGAKARVPVRTGNLRRSLHTATARGRV